MIRGMRLPLAANAPAWRRAWLRARRRSPANRRERHDRAAQLEGWSGRAASYAEHTDSPGSRRHRSEILDWLQAEGAVARPARVLDIGAGPGNYALSLAARAAEVVALEPAEGMCRLLRERLGREGVGNVQVVQQTWEEIAPSPLGWHGAFDLVFGSMSPGASSPEALEKRLDCARAWCYLSGWAGDLWSRWGLARRELWPLLFGERLGGYPNDVLYPFGLLYALGHRPALRFERPAVRLEMPAAEAAEALVQHFTRYAKIGAGRQRVIAQYVAQRSTEGVFRQEFHTCQGYLLWRIQRNGKAT